MSKHVTVKVPATTANLGPGFDCMGIALDLFNTVRIDRLDRPAPKPHPAMIREAAAAFFRQAGKPFPFSFSVSGDVPPSRGLGSSVTVRAGIVAGLNKLAGAPLTDAECLNIVVDLEGHPDNAAPAFLGGFTACSSIAVLRYPVGKKLKFVAAIPDMELPTREARAVLPSRIPFADAVENVRNAAVLSASFASGRYEMMRGAFGDRLHQPYRSKLMPWLDDAIQAGEAAGALGGYLSGAGSTVICLAPATRGVPEKVAKAMGRALAARKTKAHLLVLDAYNHPLKTR